MPQSMSRFPCQLPVVAASVLLPLLPPSSLALFYSPTSVYCQPLSASSESSAPVPRCILSSMSSPHQPGGVTATPDDSSLLTNGAGGRVIGGTPDDHAILGILAQVSPPHLACPLYSNTSRARGGNCQPNPAREVDSTGGSWGSTRMDCRGASAIRVTQCDMVRYTRLPPPPLPPRFSQSPD